MAETKPATRPKIPSAKRPRTRGTPPTQRGVLVGVLVAFGADGVPLVSYAGAPGPTGVAARATVQLDRSDVGRRVALLFEGEDLGSPIIIGCMLPSPVSGAAGKARRGAVLKATLNEEDLELSATDRLVLRCGKASISLHADGSIEIRGTDLLSRASGQNRIRGASIHLN